MGLLQECAHSLFLQDFLYINTRLIHFRHQNAFIDVYNQEIEQNIFMPRYIKCLLNKLLANINTSQLYSCHVRPHIFFYTFVSVHINQLKKKFANQLYMPFFFSQTSKFFARGCNIQFSNKLISHTFKQLSFHLTNFLKPPCIKEKGW